VVTPLAVGYRIFAPTSVWNARVAASAPLDARSPGLVAALNAELAKEVQGNYGPWINTDSFGVPVYTVGPDVPRVRVTLDVGVASLQADFESVPIPAGAQAAGGADRHLAIYQPSTDTMWEFWLAYRAGDGWHARWGGKMTDVSSNPGYFDAPYGATATSLPLLGGLITMEELKRGQIDHALALALPNTTAGAHAWPAQRGDGTTTGSGTIPLGTHFRIDPALDLSKLNLTRTGLTIARAAQRYGIVVRDTSGCAVFFAEDPVASSNLYPDLFEWAYPNQVLRDFPWQALQVVAPQPPAGG
jgi:hypothetical protein